MSADHKRIALAQISHGDRCIDVAVEQHLEWISEAREAGCDIVLFPELSLCPYACGNKALELAIPRFHETIDRLARASADITAVFGFVEEGAAAQFYNSTAVVRDSRLFFLHRKINLPNYGGLEEGKHFAPGRYVETFDLGWPWCASVLTCADLWNPALVHLAAVHGTTLLLAPIASSLEAVGADFDNPSGWDLALCFYAMIYGLPIAMCNRIGEEAGATFWGGSALIDPFGKVVERASRQEEQLVIGEIDFGEVRRARYLLPTVRDNNLALILSEMDRINDRLRLATKD